MAGMTDIIMILVVGGIAYYLFTSGKLQGLIPSASGAPTTTHAASTANKPLALAAPTPGCLDCSNPANFISNFSTKKPCCGAGG